MKKQLFSLVMVLALIVIAGTSAWAQTGLTIPTAIWQLPGSEHQITVEDAHTGTTFSWLIESITCAGGVPVTPFALPAVVSGGATATLTYRHDDAAGGIYRFSLTETANGCITIRQFFVAIMDINVVVIASDNAGAVISGAALTSCNDYFIRNGNSSIVGNADAADNTDNLNAWDSNDALFNERWANVSLTVSENTGCAGMSSIPAANTFAWRFNYTVGGTNFPLANNFIGLQTPINVIGGVAADIAYTDGTDITNTITVDQGVTGFTIPMRSNIRWGMTDVDQDQEVSFTVDSNTAVLDDDATLDYTDGREAVARNTDNTSALQHIDASPATPRITLTY